MKNTRTGKVRTAIETIHATVFTLYVLVCSTGKLTLAGFAFWTGVALAVDQALTWSLWVSAGREGPHPLQVRK